MMFRQRGYDLAILSLTLIVPFLSLSQSVNANEPGAYVPSKVFQIGAIDPNETQIGVAVGEEFAENRGPRTFLMVQYDGLEKQLSQSKILKIAEIKMQFKKDHSSGRPDYLVEVTPLELFNESAPVLPGTPSTSGTEINPIESDGVRILNRVRMGQARLTVEDFQTLVSTGQFSSVYQRSIDTSRRTVIYAMGADLLNVSTTNYQKLTHVELRFFADVVALASVSVESASKKLESGYLPFGARVGLDIHGDGALSDKFKLSFSAPISWDYNQAYNEVGASIKVSVTYSDFLKPGGTIGLFFQSGATVLSTQLLDEKVSREEVWTRSGTGIEWRY
jgi:hypothetical protein